MICRQVAEIAPLPEGVAGANIGWKM